MSIPREQTETAAFLAELAGRAAHETHISAVFIGTETVWKLKKAVKLSFVDFSRLSDRHRFLLRELELNAPAARGMYRDVVPVVRRPGGLQLGGAGEVVDWVLRMARVPAADFLDDMAGRGLLDAALLDALGDAVAADHARRPVVGGTDQPAVMRHIAEGNVASARATDLPAEQVEAWGEAMAAALAAGGAWLADRAAAGFVRRTHGDLHLGNLCLWQGRPVPFDALEFDETLATTDIAYDLAFLLMDLDVRAGRPEANRVLNRYVGRTGDAALVGGLAEFLSMRAMVRAHVAARSGGDGTAYLSLALAALHPPRGRVVAIGGLQGTGKTTLARALAPGLGAAPGALVLRSDEIRKRLHGVAPEQRLPASAYTAEANARTNAALLQAVQDAASGGRHAIIVDATFLDLAQRARIAEAARAAGLDFRGIWLQAPVAELERRIAARTGDASDATVEVLHRALAADPGPGDWMAVEAAGVKQALLF